MDLQMTVRLILLAFGSIVILTILWDGLKRRKAAVQTSQEEIESASEQQQILDENIDDLNESDIEPGNFSDEISSFSEIPEEEDEVEYPSEPEMKKNETDSFKAKYPIKDFITLYLYPSEDRPFSGYELLQTILATGFQFGEMQLFHYFQGKDRSMPKLFSLASADAPGDFNLGEMGSFSCNGLIIYQNLEGRDHPLPIFDLMLDVAFQLADDLNASLYLGKEIPWSDSVTYDIREQLKLKEAVTS